MINESATDFLVDHESLCYINHLLHQSFHGPIVALFIGYASLQIDMENKNKQMPLLLVFWVIIRLLSFYGGVRRCVRSLAETSTLMRENGLDKLRNSR